MASLHHQDTFLERLDLAVTFEDHLPHSLHIAGQTVIISQGLLVLESDFAELTMQRLDLLVSVFPFLLELAVLRLVHLHQVLQAVHLIAVLVHHLLELLLQMLIVLIFVSVSIQFVKVTLFAFHELTLPAIEFLIALV
jgi:hypothetical protein